MTVTLRLDGARRHLASAIAFSLASVATPVVSMGSPPEVAHQPPREGPAVPGRRELVAGGVLLGLGFASEVSSATIAATCSTGDWCARGYALTLGPSDGPNRFAFVSTGPSTPYVVGRVVAMPFLTAGFTMLLVGMGRSEVRPGTRANARSRRVALALLGTGVGVLAGSRIVRAVALGTGTCQDPLCVHGFDQTSLWTGRALTFAGGGLLIRDSKLGAELSFAGGPSNSYGLSITGKF